MKKILATIMLSVSAFSAHAFGPVEQAALLAITGGYLIGRASTEPYYGYGYHPAPPPHAYYGENYYYNPRPRRHCYYIPLFDAYGRQVSSTRRCEYVYPH